MSNIFNDFDYLVKDFGKDAVDRALKTKNFNDIDELTRHLRAEKSSMNEAESVSKSLGQSDPLEKFMRSQSKKQYSPEELARASESLKNVQNTKVKSPFQPAPPTSTIPPFAVDPVVTPEPPIAVEPPLPKIPTAPAPRIQTPPAAPKVNLAPQAVSGMMPKVAPILPGLGGVLAATATTVGAEKLAAMAPWTKEETDMFTWIRNNPDKAAQIMSELKGKLDAVNPDNVLLNGLRDASAAVAKKHSQMLPDSEVPYLQTPLTPLQKEIPASGEVLEQFTQVPNSPILPLPMQVKPTVEQYPSTLENEVDVAALNKQIYPDVQGPTAVDSEDLPIHTEKYSEIPQQAQEQAPVIASEAPIKPEPTRNIASELDRVIQAQNNANLAADLGKISTRLGASLRPTTGLSEFKQADTSGWDDVKKSASGIVDSYRARLELEKENPNSPYAVALRSFMKNKYGMEISDKISPSDLEKFAKPIVHQFEFEFNKELEMQKLESAAHDRAVKREELAQDKKVKRSDYYVKRIEDFSKKFNASTASSRSSLGMKSNAIVVADALDALIGVNKSWDEMTPQERDQAKKNFAKLNPQQMYELARGVDRLVTRAAPTISATEHLNPSTLMSRLATLRQFVTNKQVGAEAAEFILTFKKTIDRERKVSQQSIAKDLPKDLSTLISDYDNMDDRGKMMLENFFTDNGIPLSSVFKGKETLTEGTSINNVGNGQTLYPKSINLIDTRSNRKLSVDALEYEQLKEGFAGKPFPFKEVSE